MINYGLKKPKRDRRDFSHHKKFGSVSLESLPKAGLNRPRPLLRDQNGTYFCTGYTATSMRAAKFGIQFSPDWFVAQEAKLEKTTDRFLGASLRTECKIISKVGCLQQSEAQYSWQKNGAAMVIQPSLWDDSLIEKARPYKSLSFFSVVKDSPYDIYDSIRSALFLHDSDKEGVTAGIDWFREWNNLPDMSVCSLPFSEDSIPHNIRIYDWDEKGLIVEPHIGKILHIPREVANKYLYTSEGPFLFVDSVDTEAIKKEQWGLLETVKNWLIRLGAWLFVRHLDVPVPQIVIPDQYFPEEAPKIETPQQMVLRVCKEENMGDLLTDQIYRTVQCESNFYIHAKRENKDESGKVLSTDWGICQYNDYYYIGSGKPIPSVDVALNDPEFCVRVMCRMFKQGRARDWICWRRIFNQP